MKKFSQYGNSGQTIPLERVMPGGVLLRVMVVNISEKECCCVCVCGAVHNNNPRSRSRSLTLHRVVGALLCTTVSALCSYYFMSPFIIHVTSRDRCQPGLVSMPILQYITLQQLSQLLVFIFTRCIPRCESRWCLQITWIIL